MPKNVGEQKTEEPKKEEQKVEQQPKAEEPKAEAPKAEQPKKAEPKAEQPKKAERQPKAQKRDNPRPFVKFQKLTQVVIDDKTKQPVINPRTGKPVEAVIGYKPLLRKGGLTEEILNTGNLKTLEEFWEDHEEDLNEAEKEYMEARLTTAREVNRLGDAAKADLAEGKTAPRPEPDEKDGFVGFSNLKYPNTQTSGNGCWSCSYSLLLKSRGVDLSQEKIRAWRPDRSKDTTKDEKRIGIQRKRNAASFRMNTDGVNGLMENADLLGQVLPNTSMAQISMKPLVPDELTVDGKQVDKKQYQTILKYYQEQMKTRLTDTIRQAIEVDKSPVALSIDGHFVTITGISKDGKTIRYEDSLPAKGKTITQTMAMDEIVHRATEDHKSWSGHTVGPKGLSLTWIKDINVPEYGKRAEEKPVIHAEEPGLVTLDENGKITVDVPATHESANAMGDMATGQIEGKGVSYPVTLKQEELTKLMGGKPFFSVGIGGGYTMGYADVYYPGRIYYKNDPELTYGRFRGEEAHKLFDGLVDAFAGVERNARRAGKGGAWTQKLLEFQTAFETIRDYAENPQDPKCQASMPEALDKLKELPGFLAGKEGDQTNYDRFVENMTPLYRAENIKGLLKLNETMELGINFKKLMGVQEIHPHDVDYREDQKFEWNSLAGMNDRNEITRKVIVLGLSRILARAALRDEKIAAGEAHPEIKTVELNKRAAQIRGSETFQRMTAGERIYELAASGDTAGLQKAYADSVKAAAREEPKAEGNGQEDPKVEERKQEEPKAEGQNIVNKIIEPITAPPKAPEEKKELKEKLTLFDIQQGQWTGGSALFGLLGDTLTTKEIGSIYKKMSIMTVLRDDPDATMVYGQKYEGIAEDLSDGKEELLEREAGPIRQNFKKSGVYDHYTDERIDAPLKIYQEGMRELGAAMEKKAKTGHFASPAEQNYFFLMKGFIDDINNGTFSKKYLENPVYEYAHNMTGKIRNTAPDASVKEKDGKYIFSAHVKQKVDDFRNVRILQETGMINAMAGAMKVTEMLEDHVNGGDVGREELIAEYRLQQQRMEKALSISREKFAELNEQGVFDNDYDEFTAEGARGYGYALEDARARAEFLEAGYPASDLAAVSPFIRAMAGLKRDNNAEQKKLDEDIKTLETDLKKLAADQKKLPEDAAPEKIKALEDRKAQLDQKKEQLDQRKAALDPKLESQRLMEEAWTKVKDTSGHVTAQERTEKLQALQSSAVAIRSRFTKEDHLDIAAHHLEQRLGAGLTLSEQALMAAQADTLYRIIDDRNVDPRLMRSSDQFKKFKEALKKLAEMEKNLDPTDKADIYLYQRQAARVAQAGNNYLRYKTKQMSDSSHDRSKTEALRVSVVDAIVSNLKTVKVPGTGDPILNNEAKPLGVTVPETGDRVLGTQQKGSLPVDYDSYIRLHTGRAAANGTRQEMVEDLAKVMAAYMLKTAKNPVKFDLKHIHDCAEKLKEKFNLDDLDRKNLSRYLSSQSKVKDVIKEIRRDTYGLKEGVTYEKYLSQMRELYQQMAEPTKDDTYKKLFAQVEKVAHLPEEDPEGINRDRLMEVVEGANFEILRLAEKCAVENATNQENRIRLNGAAGEAMDVLSVMSDLTASSEERFQRTQERVNASRGTETVEGDYLSVQSGGFAYVDRDDYGVRHFGNEVRELDENKLKAMKQTVQKSLMEQVRDAIIDAKEAVNTAEQKILKGAAQDAKEAIKTAKKPKEAPEASNRPKLDGTGKKADGKKPEPKKDAEKKEAEKKETEKKAAEKQENKIKRSNTLGR